LFDLVAKWFLLNGLYVVFVKWIEGVEWS